MASNTIEMAEAAQGLSSAEAAARLVHERADATARRIAAEWELSERILAALDEQGAASPRTPCRTHDAPRKISRYAAVNARSAGVG